MTHLPLVRSGIWPDRPERETTFAFRFAPEPLGYETAQGWLRRALRMHGQLSFPIFAAQFGLNPRNASRETCLRIAENSGTPHLDRLARNTARRVGTRMELLGVSVPQRYWSNRDRRYCPGCLHESVHHRAYWDYGFFLTCPFHGLPILGDSGSGRVTWAPADLATDHDGKYLPVRTPRLEKPIASLEALFMARLGALAADPDEWLDPNEMDEIAWASRALGGFLLGEGTYRPGGARKALAKRQDTGFSALRQGRNAVAEMLSERADQEEAKRPKRSESPIGYLFGWFSTVARARDGPIARDLAQAMEEIACRGGRRRMWGRSKAPPPVKDGMMTLTEFASALGIGTRAVRRIPVLEDVLPRGRGGSSRLYFSREDLAAARIAVDTAMTAADARTALGLRITDLPRLEVARLVRCVPHRHPVLNSKAYLRADVEALLERIAAFDATEVPSVGFERMVTALRVTSGVLACRAMAGEVRPIGVGGRGRGFRSLRFDPAGAGVAPTQPGKSVTDAAVRLGVSAATVRMLIETGRLNVIGEGIWRGGISPASIESLAAGYVSTESLVVALGCHPRGIASRLAGIGVPVLKVGRDAIGLVARADATKVLRQCTRTARPSSTAAVEHGFEGLPRVRRWRPARIGFSAEGIVYVATTQRVTATLALGTTTELTVDCSRAAGARRHRIAGLVEGTMSDRLPGFRMERGTEGRCVLRASMNPTVFDQEGLFARDRWIEARLDNLADVFTLVDAEKRLMPR